MSAKKKASKFTIARLIACGALLGFAVAGVAGVDTSAWATTIFGASGAAIAAIALKTVHLF